MRLSSWILIQMHTHEKKNYGFTPNLDFNLLSARFNLTEFLLTSMHSETWESMKYIKGEAKRTSKHDISIVLKLVSTEYQKRPRMHFWQRRSEGETDWQFRAASSSTEKSLNCFYPWSLTGQHPCVQCTISTPAVQCCAVHSCTTLLYTAI